jgi:spermidine synthase
VAEADEGAAAHEAAAAAPSWARFIPNLTVFISSLCIMVVELVAGRLIASHVGSSLYTWTSVIGIVLSGIAVGNYVGGRLADRYRANETLTSLFLLSSGLCLLVPVLNEWVGDWMASGERSLALRIAIHVFLVFFPPPAMLGTISPVAAKMALELGRETGRTVGSVYSWGALGSIVGTFITGYYLIAQLGTIMVLFSVATVLAAMALIFGTNGILPVLWAGVVMAMLFTARAPWGWAAKAGERLGLREIPNGATFFLEESNYSAIRVERHHDNPTVRAMWLDSLIHAWIDMDDPDDLRYEYEDIYAGVTLSAIETAPSGVRRALFLGGGGFVFPRWVLRHWPAMEIQVAELDPAVTRAAFAAFGLERDTPMKIFNLDARNHVDDLIHRLDQGEAAGGFDLVYGDAFNHFSPPFHLTTYEFNEKLRRLMSPHGVLLANVIDVYKSGKFLGAMLNTIEMTFPHVYIFSSSSGGPSDADARDTFVVAGSIRALPLTDFDSAKYSGWLLDEQQLATLRERSNHLVLTDDFAPVDNLLAPVIGTGEYR